MHAHFALDVALEALLVGGFHVNVFGIGFSCLQEFLQRRIHQDHALIAARLNMSFDHIRIPFADGVAQTGTGNQDFVGAASAFPIGSLDEKL